MAKLSSILKYNIILPILQREISATKVSQSEGIPVRTLRHWVKQFSEKGLQGIERAKRKDSGSTRIITQELTELIQGLALQKPPLTISSIHRKLVILSERSNVKPPSYETVYGLVKKINPALLTLAHEGSKAYQQKYELIYRRQCNQSNEIWQCDHTEVDIYVLDDHGRERKPWLTTVMDDYSRAIAGIFLSMQAPSSINTALALRQAIWKKEDSAWEICGIPQILYTDHGSDFMSNHIEQVCIDLKIRMLNSAVGRPQGRGKIERFFQTLNECVLCDLPGYSIKGKPTSKPSLTLAQLEAAIRCFILNKYHISSHSATGLPPIKMWAEGFLPNLPQSTELLDLLLLTIQKPRKIQRDGIRFQGMRYIAPTLAGFVGELINIRYDPRDLAEIKVYYCDQFLCKAVCQDIAEMVVSLKEIKAARSTARKELYGQVKQSQFLLKKQSQTKKTEHIAAKPEELLSNNTLPTSSSLKLYKNE